MVIREQLPSQGEQSIQKGQQYLELAGCLPSRVGKKWKKVVIYPHFFIFSQRSIATTPKRLKIALPVIK
jgi:hypothetical protein